MAVELPRVIVNPEFLTKPRGYAHAVLSEVLRNDGMVVAHISMAGQTGSGIDGKILRPGDVVGQTEDTLANMRIIAEAAGVRLQALNRVRMFVADKNAFIAAERQIGPIWRDYFGGYYPPTTLVEVASLYDDDAVIELEGEGFATMEPFEFDAVRARFAPQL